MRTEGAFRAWLPGFDEVRALAESFGMAVRADRDLTLRVVLVLEELFTNTVTHGYPEGSEGPVWVTLNRQGSAIAVIYEDAAPAFDPLGQAPVPSRAAEGAPGGLGLALVRGLSVSVSYARVGERNRISLTVAGSLPAP